MKKNCQFRRTALALAGVFASLSAASLPAMAQKWDVVILPASVNEDRALRLAAGHTQILTFTIQADDVVRARGQVHKVVLEFDLPEGASIPTDKGYYKLTEKSKTSRNGRTIIQYDAEVDNNHMVGKPGERVSTEWHLHAAFVNTPKSVPHGQDFVTVRIIDGDNVQSFNWPLKLEEIKVPAARPKRTTIGLWDYNFQLAEHEEAAAGVARFFHDSGISFTQNDGDNIYRKALQKQGIVTGGNTHHDYFYDHNNKDVDAAGNVHTGFPDTQGILQLPEGAPIAGASKIVEFARRGDGIATYDYEPTGIIGFSDVAIKAFQEKYKVSDADFKVFREYVAKNGLQTHLSTDPLISKTWAQWTEFRSDQTSNYVRRLYQAVKATAPEVKVAVTPSRSYGHGTKSTLALGTDNAAMAQYTDIIMPQLYAGYGASSAKLAMVMTEGWREELTKQNAKTQLWPLLLVRYAGATPRNSPQRVYQQSIGSMANGADGIMLYYPGNMDAPYWNVTARLSETLAKYEDFYHDGKRVDEQFKLSQLPLGNTGVNMWPGYTEPVENPTWEFTAHQLGNRILLTLINLEEADDLVFGIDVGQAKHISSENVEAISGKLSTIREEQVVAIDGANQWLVAPGQIGFIILERG